MLDPIEVIRQSVALQTALSTIILYLNFTGYLFPLQAQVKDGNTYDFIVVGAGAAGSVIASRLSEEKKFNVLLVEEGAEPPLQCMVPGLMHYAPNSLIDNNFTSQNDHFTMKCREKGVVQMIQGKVIGGSTCLDYMFYSRGRPYDFDVWASISRDDTWSWRNVLPYFKKSEKLEDVQILNSPDRIYHGTEGYVKVTRELSDKTNRYLKSFAEIGNPIIADINSNQSQGYTQPMYRIADSIRQSAGICFLSPAKDRPNFSLLKNSLVSRILFDNNKRATGVEIITENNKIIVVNARREVIVSAGALKSPQLLMLSGIGPKQHLNSLNIGVVKDLPVGQNLKDHIVVPIYIQMNKTTVPYPSRNFNIYPFETVNGYVAIKKSQVYPDYQTQLFIIPHDSELPLLYFGYDFKYSYDVLKISADGIAGREVTVTLVNNLHPKSRGVVLLRSSDPKDSPLFYTGYYSKKQDLENAVIYIKDFLRVLDTSYFKNVKANTVYLAGDKCSEFKLGSSDYWRCYALCMSNSAFDYIGTCAMGSVVDGKLRVIGVKGLRVADASVIPECTSGNVAAPAMMIGEKVSDMIKNDYK